MKRDVKTIKRAVAILLSITFVIALPYMVFADPSNDYDHGSDYYYEEPTDPTYPTEYPAYQDEPTDHEPDYQDEPTDEPTDYPGYEDEPTYYEDEPTDYPGYEDEPTYYEDEPTDEEEHDDEYDDEDDDDDEYDDEDDDDDEYDDDEYDDEDDEEDEEEEDDDLIPLHPFALRALFDLEPRDVSQTIIWEMTPQRPFGSVSDFGIYALNDLIAVGTTSNNIPFHSEGGAMVGRNVTIANNRFLDFGGAHDNVGVQITNNLPRLAIGGNLILEEGNRGAQLHGSPPRVIIAEHGLVIGTPYQGPNDIRDLTNENINRPQHLDAFFERAESDLRWLNQQFASPNFLNHQGVSEAFLSGAAVVPRPEQANDIIVHNVHQAANGNISFPMLQFDTWFTGNILINVHLHSPVANFPGGSVGLMGSTFDGIPLIPVEHGINLRARLVSHRIIWNFVGSATLNWNTATLIGAMLAPDVSVVTGPNTGGNAKGEIIVRDLIHHEGGWEQHTVNERQWDPDRHRPPWIVVPPPPIAPPPIIPPLPPVEPPTHPPIIPPLPPVEPPTEPPTQPPTTTTPTTTAAPVTTTPVATTAPVTTTAPATTTVAPTTTAPVTTTAPETTTAVMTTPDVTTTTPMMTTPMMTTTAAMTTTTAMMTTTGPSGPTDPDIPTDPTTPVDPGTPGEPGEPGVPTDPETPVDPGTPVDPIDPAIPPVFPIGPEPPEPGTPNIVIPPIFPGGDEVTITPIDPPEISIQVGPFNMGALNFALDNLVSNVADYLQDLLQPGPPAHIGGRPEFFLPPDTDDAMPPFFPGPMPPNLNPPTGDFKEFYNIVKTGMATTFAGMAWVYLWKEKRS